MAFDIDAIISPISFLLLSLLLLMPLRCFDAIDAFADADIRHYADTPAISLYFAIDADIVEPLLLLLLIIDIIFFSLFSPLLFSFHIIDYFDYYLFSIIDIIFITSILPFDISPLMPCH
jgi:hypothetical protein